MMQTDMLMKAHQGASIHILAGQRRHGGIGEMEQYDQ